MPALNPAFNIAVHIVAQVVKAKLVIRAVSDVAGIVFLAPRIVHIRKNCTNGQPQITEDGAHPFSIAAR